MATVRQLLTEALAALDVASTLERHEVLHALETVGKAAKESGENVDELRFELAAACLALYERSRVWGTCYGPEMGTIDKDGKRIDIPPMESITPECIGYWTERMHAARYPALRARYADLVWDLSDKATGKKPPIVAARIAIDGYVETLTAHPETPPDSWGDIRKRVIDLAISIGDEDCLRQAVAANVAYANVKVDTEEGDFRLRSLFEILKTIPPKRRPQVEFQAVVDKLRDRLDSLNAKEADQFRIDRYAFPLADYYWSSQQREDAKTVMRMYGAAVRRMVEKTPMAILGVGWLRRLHKLYVRYEMHDEAKQVLNGIEELQPRVPHDLLPISVSQHISKEELEEWLDWLITDDADESVVNLTGHFLPNVAELRRQFEVLANDYPLSQMFATASVDHNGRAIAETASDDAEGKLIQHIYQDTQFRNPFLGFGLDRLFEKHSIGPDEVFTWVTESPVWHPHRHAILRRGIEACFAGDAIAAVHILVTEIESAIRIIADGLGLATQRQNRMGGFDLKNLGDFLADEAVAAFLGEDIVTYLRVVLTDRRGWNLRNHTCHGLIPAASFTQAAAQRLLHIVLVLSAVRTKTETEAQTTERPSEPPGSADMQPQAKPTADGLGTSCGLES